MKMETSVISRRDFIGKTAGGIGAGLVQVPLGVPVRGRDPEGLGQAAELARRS